MKVGKLMRWRDEMSAEKREYRNDEEDESISHKRYEREMRS